MSDKQQPYKRCGVCGEGVTCEHGLCNACQRCRACGRLDRAWDDLGNELNRMANEEPPR